MTFEQHLPVIQVVLPLVAAPLMVVVRKTNVVWLLTLLVTLAAFVISLLILERTLTEGTISYALGGWEPPWGIEYRIDALGAFVLMIVSGIGAFVMVYSRASVFAEMAQHRIYLFYTMYLLCLTGLLGIVATGDVFNLYVFLEISSLATYVLVALGKDNRALTASFRYLILGTIGATFYVIGIGLLYMMTGTLNMMDLAERLSALPEYRTLLVAFTFITVGLSLKIALFPLHMWLPNAYTYAPSVVTAFLAATATKVAVYAFLRMFFTVFGSIDLVGGSDVGYVLATLAVMAMFAGSIKAIYQVNIKRLLAYSSIAQIGYIVLGLSLASTMGVASSIIHLFNHALMKCALFMVAGAIFLRLGSVKIQDITGLGRRMPWTMAAFTAGGLGLIGVPTTAGFVSKWYLIQAALERGWILVAFLVPLSSLLAVFYVWKVIEAAYFRPVPADALPVREAPPSMLIPIWLLVIGVFYFGLNAQWTVELATEAAQTLLRKGL